MQACSVTDVLGVGAADAFDALVLQKNAQGAEEVSPANVRKSRLKLGEPKPLRRRRAVAGSKPRSKEQTTVPQKNRSCTGWFDRENDLVPSLDGWRIELEQRDFFSRGAESPPALQRLSIHSYGGIRRWNWTSAQNRLRCQIQSIRIRSPSNGHI
jgi:hypothetical protein